MVAYFTVGHRKCRVISYTLKFKQVSAVADEPRDALSHG